MRRIVGLAGVCLALTGSAAAWADRPGQAPVRAPNALDTVHVNFTLPGDGWGQARGQTAATPEIGRYGQTGSSGCRLLADVNATLTASRPRAHGRHVSVPGHFGAIKIADHGTNHGIRWWLGSHAGVRTAALGYQQAPRALARGAHRWVTYEVILRSVSSATSCTPTEGLKAGRVIVRTMHLVAGKINITGPYFP